MLPKMSLKTCSSGYGKRENHFENYLALKSYLYLSARNSCLNYIKHHNIVLEYAQNLVQKETDEQTWDTIVETEIISLLSDYIRHLPGECAKIMELVMQGYNSTEISTLTGASSSTVRSQKQQGYIAIEKMVSPRNYTRYSCFSCNKIINPTSTNIPLPGLKSG